MADITYIKNPKTNPILVKFKREDKYNKNNLLFYPKMDGKLLLLDDLQNGKFNVSNFIVAPVILEPLNNSVDFTGTVKIKPYRASNTFRGTHDKTIVELSNDVNFTNVIKRIETDTDEVDFVLAPVTSKVKNYIRAKHVSGEHSSRWSEPTIVTTAQLEYILKPTILNPINGSTGNLVKHMFIKGSSFTVVGANDSSHEYTEYQISTTSDFSNVIARDYIRVNREDIVLSDITLEYGQTYYLRIRYQGTKYGSSPWSDTIEFRTRETSVDLGVDGNNDRLAGNDLDGAYYGEIDTTRLENYNYRGSYLNTTQYLRFNTVKHNGIKYRALHPITNVEPGTDEYYWEIDTRDALPKMKWLLDEIGIAYGLTDNNVDGLSSDSLVSGTMVNSDTSWLKFVHDEKLLYISKKPIVDNISWNDVAKRYAVYNNDRTVKIGSRLYYIRLITEEEYTALLVAVSNGTLGTISPTDMELDKQCWITDTEKGFTRKTLSGVGSQLDNVDAKSRTCSYRPVLELIKIGEEPYNNLPDCAAAEYENFIYDVETDTGYFGVTSKNDLAPGDALASLLGLGDGISINNESNYAKCYWHGKIVYIALKPLRHSIIKEDLLSLNAVHGVDLGNRENKVLVNSGIKYKIAIPTGTGKAISPSITTSNDPLSTVNFLNNIKLEIGKGSMWNELIYRLHGGFIDDVLANQDTINYVENHGGMEIGNNFANFSSDDLGIGIGMGSNTLCQEVSTVNPLETVSRGYYFLAGIVRQGYNQRLNIFGWRPVLILDKE